MRKDQFHRSFLKWCAESQTPKKMCEFLAEEQLKGYVVSRGKISFLVYWKNKDNEKEILIALAEIEMKKVEG